MKKKTLGSGHSTFLTREQLARTPWEQLDARDFTIGFPRQKKALDTAHSSPHTQPPWEQLDARDLTIPFP